jgi:hypothetical protein
VPLFSHKRTAWLIAIVTALVLWHQFRTPDTQPKPEPSSQLPRAEPTSGQPEPLASPPPAEMGTPVMPPSTLPASPSSAVAVSSSAGGISPLPQTSPAAETSSEDITEDLNALDSAIRDFHAVLGENPIGSNIEITAALLGNNPKQLKLEVPAGSRINPDGAMCDRWGTPYFFHQISATEMEIRSAGPDRIMWTGDDSHM